MIIQAIKYLFSTPRSEIKADMKQYRTLVRHCHGMQQEAIKARSHLIVDIPIDQNFENYSGCLKYKYFMPVLNYGMDDGEHKVAYDICVCPNFTETRGVACPDVTCPHSLQNLKYFWALKNYDQAHAARKNFWRQKFIRMK